MTKLTAHEAADRLGVTRFRVYALIRTGRLPATKWGRDWQIDETDLQRVAVRQAGRPKKALGVYYTPPQVLDPAAGTGAFLKDALDTVRGNPPYQKKAE